VQKVANGQKEKQAQESSTKTQELISKQQKADAKKG
jgi:hypothetical protein